MLRWLTILRLATLSLFHHIFTITSTSGIALSFRCVPKTPLTCCRPLPEKCVMNCTGLGSMTLFNDNDMMPIGGQLSFLIPQPDFSYRLTTENGYAIPRKDGIILGGNALEGSWNETPDPAQTEKVVHALREVMNKLRA